MNHQTSQINKKQSGFALLYAMLIMLLVSMTIAAITTSTLGAIKRMRKSREVAQVYQVANAGMEKGIANWRDIDKTDIGNTCIKGMPCTTSDDQTDGYYTVDFDETATPNTITTNAYFGKSRIRFKAEVTSVLGVDKFTVYQIGF